MLTVMAIVAGAVFAFWLVGLPFLKDPPDSYWYLFGCGMVAICALVLPGISGALEMGARHGVYCLGCCWFLMALLFAGGLLLSAPGGLSMASSSHLRNSSSGSAARSCSWMPSFS